MLQIAREVADWTDTILCMAGQDLYLHVRPQGQGRTRRNLNWLANSHVWI